MYEIYERNCPESGRKFVSIKKIVPDDNILSCCMTPSCAPCHYIENPFFRKETADWPFSRLVDLVTDTRLVEKPAASVVYEEGISEEADMNNDREGVPRLHESKGERRDGQGHAVHGPGEGDREASKDRWIAGAYVVLRGTVDLYVMEKRVATMATTEEINPCSQASV